MMSHGNVNYECLVTCKAHGNYGRKPCRREFKMSRQLKSTCNAHEETCCHMVITARSHVHANYKCFVTSKAHVTHMRNMWSHGNYWRKPCGRKVQMSRYMQSTCNAHEETCGHMLITGGNHVEKNCKFNVS